MLFFSTALDQELAKSGIAIDVYTYDCEKVISGFVIHIIKRK